MSGASKKKSTKTVKDLTEQLVYCGPSLKNLQQYTIYKNDLPDNIKILMEKNIGIRELFVPVKELGRVRENINKKGTRENQLYMKALKYARGVNN